MSTGHLEHDRGGWTVRSVIVKREKASAFLVGVAGSPHKVVLRFKLELIVHSSTWDGKSYTYTPPIELTLGDLGLVWNWERFQLVEQEILEAKGNSSCDGYIDEDPGPASVYAAPRHWSGRLKWVPSRPKSS